MTKEQINVGKPVQDKSDYRLSDEQLAELRRRRSEKNPKTMSLEEFDKRLRRFGV